MIRHFVSRQFVTFVFVGVSAALLHWLARIALSLWMSFDVAVFIAYWIGMGVAFTLNRVLVFPASARPINLQVRDFLLTNLSFLPVILVAALGLNAWLRAAGWTWHTEEIAHGFALAIPMAATFLIYKLIAFRE